jgi:hypothetical protein
MLLLAFGPKIRGLKPDWEERFLRAIKIPSRTSFGGEVKPSAPHHKILRLVKHPFSMKEQN